MALTQPAVSLQIRQLEELVGQPLFEYVGKKLYLTDAAEALLKTSTDLFQRLESLDMQLSDLKGSLQGQLRLAVESSAKYITPHLFKAFQNLHPEVSLSLTVVNRTQVIKRLADNRDDLVIMSLVPQDMALEFLPFLNNPIIAVAPPDHPLCNAAKLALKDLEPFPLLVREPGSGTRKACEEFFQQRRAHFADPGDRLAGVPARRGDRRPRPGPAAAPCGAPGTGQRLLRELPVEELPLYRSWCLVHAKGKRLSPVAQAFVAFVREERALISQLAGRFAGPGGSS